MSASIASFRLNPFLLVRLVVFAGLAVLITNTKADPDLWGHVRFGDDIVAAGRLPSFDTYSFTSDQRWINHEWLAEVVMSGAYSVAGSTGLITLKSLIVFGAVWLVWWPLNGRISPMVQDLLAVLAVIGMRRQIATVRPQLFSLLLFAAIVILLARAERGRLRNLVALPAIMALWVNLHGGWIVGGAVCGIWLAFAMARREASLNQRLFFCGIAASMVLATLLNPYGAGLWRFLWATVGFGRADISEWQPVTRFPDALFLWMVVAAAAVAMVRRARERPPWSTVAIVSLLALGAFRVNRLGAFFTLSTIMMLVPLLSRAGGFQPLTPNATRVAAVFVSALALAGVSVAAGVVVRQGQCIEMDEDWLPEAAAGAFLRQNHLQGRMLTWFDWGQYAIWHLAPEVKVSLDGRRETVYSEGLLSKHDGLYDNPPGAMAFLESLDPDVAWLPAGRPISQELEHRGWQAIFRGPISVVLTKRPRVGIQTESYGTPPRRCFPGP